MHLTFGHPVLRVAFFFYLYSVYSRDVYPYLLSVSDTWPLPLFRSKTF